MSVRQHPSLKLTVNKINSNIYINNLELIIFFKLLKSIDVISLPKAFITLNLILLYNLYLTLMIL